MIREDLRLPAKKIRNPVSPFVELGDVTCLVLKLWGPTWRGNRFRKQDPKGFPGGKKQ